MICSQGLWQHGSVNLVLLGMIYALLRARPGWLLAAGVMAGLLPVVRPTAVLFSIAAAVFVVLAMGRRAGRSFSGRSPASRRGSRGTHISFIR